MEIKKISSVGKKAHPPLWWVKLNLLVPQLSWSYLDYLYTNSIWFKKFITNLPQKCPFEQQFWINNTLVYFVPALCKFNPFYTQLMTLKLKQLMEN